MHRGYLYNDRLFVFRCLLQRVDKLAQILNGVNIVVGGGRDGVGPLGHHAGPGHIAYDLRPGQVSADARLCPLTHLDLNGGAGLQILLVYAEAAGGHLDDGVVPVGVEVLVESALAGIIADAQLLSRLGQAGMGVVADGAVAHGGEHHRHGQLDLRRQRADKLPLFVPADAVGPEKLSFP